MNDPFHEAKEAFNTGYKYYTSVGSLNAMAAYSMNQACENAVRALWIIATGEPFPYAKFKPLHKPAKYVEHFGLHPLYSTETRLFLSKLTGFALDDVRYEESQAFRNHTKEISGNRAKEIVVGTEKFLRETEKLSSDHSALELIVNYRSKIADR